MGEHKEKQTEEKKEGCTEYTVKITYGHEKLEDCLENMLKAMSEKIELDI